MALIQKRLINQLIDLLGARMARKFMSAINDITDRSKITKIEEIFAEIQENVTKEIVDDVLKAAGVRIGNWVAMTEEHRAGYYEAGKFYIDEEVPFRFGATFDLGNQRVQEWLEHQSSRMIQQLTSTQREVVRAHLVDGFNNGRNPHSVALDLVGRVGPAAGGPKSGSRKGGVIGLNLQQLQLTIDMRDALSSYEVGVLRIDKNGNPVKKFWIGDDGKLQSVYTRRDRRFDGTILKAIQNGEKLPQSKIDRLVSRYRDRLLELRGSTIGRTEALSSMNEAQHESLRQTIDNGYAEEDAVIRKWHHSKLDNARPGHEQMDGQERGLNDPFVNPVTGIELMHPNDGPGSESINCRCKVEHIVDFLAIEGLATPNKPKPDKPPKPKKKVPVIKAPKKKKHPWEMSKTEYDKRLPLKEQKSIWVDTGSKGERIEILRNPSPRDLSAMRNEAIEKYGKSPVDPVMRYTYDAEGNKYYWAAADGTHSMIEPYITQIEGVNVDQGAFNKASHRSIVRRALYEGKKVPQNVLDFYPTLIDEVKAIKGNKVVQSLSVTNRPINRPAEGIAETFYEKTLAGRDTSFAEAAEAYIGEPNELMNLYLRGEPIPDYYSEEEKEAAKYAVDDLLREWDKLAYQSDADMTVYRGFSTDDLSQFQVGSVITDDGFWATATNIDDAGRFTLAGDGKHHVLLEIDTPSGTQIFSPNASVDEGYFDGPRFHSVEKELVLAPESSFEVLDVYTEEMTVYNMWEDRDETITVTRVVVRMQEDNTTFGGLLERQPDGPEWDRYKSQQVDPNARWINSVDDAVQWTRDNSGRGGNKTEHGVILGPDNRLLDARKGNENSIPYGEDGLVDIEDDLMPNGKYIHTHPGSAALSGGDIRFANHYDLSEMMAVGTDFENYFLTNNFKKAKNPLIAELGALDTMRQDIHESMWEFADSDEITEFLGDYVEPMTLRQRTLAGEVPFDVYNEQYWQFKPLTDQIHIAKTILINELVAEYGGYDFSYTLQAGSHRYEVRQVMQHLIDSGFLDAIEREHQLALQALEGLWKPNKWDD